MMVLENVDVTTRARRVHLDLPHSQVMGVCHVQFEGEIRFIPTLVVEGEVWRVGEKNSEILEIG